MSTSGYKKIATQNKHVVLCDSVYISDRPTKPPGTIVKNIIFTLVTCAILPTMPVPIILAGKAEPVAEMAIRDMKPEADGMFPFAAGAYLTNFQLTRLHKVVHFVFINDARREIPILSTGGVPNPRNPHGSGDFEKTPPKAIVFTMIYRDVDIAMLRKTTLEVGGQGAKYLPWLRVDRALPTPPVGPEMVSALSARVKEVLDRLDKEGKLIATDDIVDFYY